MKKKTLLTLLLAIVAMMWANTSSAQSLNAAGATYSTAYVDLGLENGTLWATCNIGATKPEEYGNYYAWGEVATKAVYSWDTYKWGTADALTKYNTTDGKIGLDPEDDVAKQVLGGLWEIPSYYEIDKLVKGCDWKIVTINGVKGRQGTSKKNGNTIFLPFAGYRDGSQLKDTEAMGNYWLRHVKSQEEPDKADVYRIFDDAYTDKWEKERCMGYVIRPIIRKQNLGFKIAGEEVTSVNYKNLTSLENVKEGNVSYDYDTNTLTLAEVTITSYLNEMYGIENESNSGLKIKLIGNNRINCSEYALYVRENTTITGDGSLTLISSNTEAVQIIRGNFTIDNCDMNIRALYGIVGVNTENTSVTIRSSNVTIETDYWCMGIFKSLNLEGCFIKDPAGAYFDNEMHYLMLNGAVVQKKLVFSKNYEPYAVENGSTLTFYYDNNKATRTGTKYDISTHKWIGTYRNPNQRITKAVFNSSFKDYRPTTTASWFDCCSKIETIEGMENLNTKEVTDMSFMFNRCSSLKALDLSNFNTVKVTNMGSMFYGCKALTSLDVSKFNTANVTNMRTMFNGCSSLKSLDVTNFNTGNVTDMCYMFSDCLALTSLDVSNFNTKKVTAMTSMFFNCPDLTTIYCNDDWNKGVVAESKGMFYDCPKLKGAATYDQTKTDVSMANPTTGYFTMKDPSGIDAVTVDTPAARRGIYTLNGVRLNTSPDNLPAGIYVIDGRKVVKR